MAARTQDGRSVDDATADLRNFEAWKRDIGKAKAATHENDVAEGQELGMNVKMVFADRIDSWDTRADGGATTTHASLEVSGRQLELWSALTFDANITKRESPVRRPSINRDACRDRRNEATGLKTLPEFLDALGEEKGLPGSTLMGRPSDAPASPSGAAGRRRTDGSDDRCAMW